MGKATDHIVTYEKDLGFRCLNCGMKQTMSLPVDLDVYLAAGKAFIEVHKRCKKKELTPA